MAIPVQADLSATTGAMAVALMPTLKSMGGEAGMYLKLPGLAPWDWAMYVEEKGGERNNTRCVMCDVCCAVGGVLCAVYCVMCTV